MKDNNLNEILLIMMEEAAEVQKLCSKIIRFGASDFHPEDESRTTNAEKLLGELYDLETMKLLAMMDGDAFGFDHVNARDMIVNKLNKLKQWSTINNNILNAMIDTISNED